MEEINEQDGAIEVGYGMSENFDDLYRMINLVGFKNNIDQTFSHEELIKMIEEVKRGERPVTDLPETFDLRSTVERLVETSK